MSEVISSLPGGPGEARGTWCKRPAACGPALSCVIRLPEDEEGRRQLGGLTEAEGSSELLLQRASEPFENTACQTEEASLSSSPSLCSLSRNWCGVLSTASSLWLLSDDGENSINGFY